jgi:NADP-dependent 3-hydroxy acid dehydrogenase YdfG
MMGHRQVEQAALFYEFSLEGDGLVAVTQAVLPSMRQQRRGVIVNVSSVTAASAWRSSGPIAPPNMGRGPV